MAVVYTSSVYQNIHTTMFMAEYKNKQYNKLKLWIQPLKTIKNDTNKNSNNIKEATEDKGLYDISSPSLNAN